MTSADPARRFADILENVARLRGHIAGMNRAAFLRDIKTQDAVERCLERVAEAARKLGPAWDTRYPDCDLPKLRDLGSVLRHGYDGIDPALIWEALARRLDPLEKMARAELAAQRVGTGLGPE
jgi:uncharacterized protein with HEPN domain